MTNGGFVASSSFHDPARAAGLPDFAYDTAASVWEPYQDPRLGFAVERPTGWNVVADAHTILVYSPERSAFVLAVSIHGAPGISATAWLEKLPSAYPSLFPQAQAMQITPQPQAAAAPGGVQPPEEAVGVLSYQGVQGAGRARLLCSVAPDGSGMVYAIAALSDRFEAQRETLLRILKSLTFHAPQPGAGDGEGAPAALTYTAWTDPREGAFHIEAPQGWTVEGGAFRFGPTDIRNSVRLRSPQDDILVQIGDPGITGFAVPTPFLMQMGLHEGQVFSPTGTFQSTVLRYLPARDFNRWYLQTHLSAALDNLAVVTEQALPEIARQHATMLDQISGGMSQVAVDVVSTEFTGRDRQSGRPVTGMILATVDRYPQDPMGGMMWTASLQICRCTADDQAEARKATAAAVLLHLVKSWRDDPQWSRRNQEMQAQILQQQNRDNQQFSNQMNQRHQDAMDHIRRAGERSREMARDSDERRAAMMGAHWRRQAADDNQQRQRINYLSDQTDVRDTNTGESWKVGSGYNHYYRNAQTDTILATDSATTPGIDFTRLEEF